MNQSWIEAVADQIAEHCDEIGGKQVLKMKTPKTDSMMQAVGNMKPETVVVPVAFAREMERDHYLMDSVKTREINVLVTENRALITKRDGMLVLLKKTLNVLTEFGQITDESRVGWLIKDIDRVLGECGCASEWRDTPKPESGTLAHCDESSKV